MHKLLWLFVLIPFCSCMPPNAYRFDIKEPKSHHVNNKDIEDLIETLALTLKAVDKETYTQETIVDTLNKISAVYFVDEPIDCSPVFGEEMYCVGLYYPPGVIYVTWNECLPVTAFTHELIHHFLYHTTGSTDGIHTNPIYWAQESSVVALTNWLSCVIQCPELCGQEVADEEEKLSVSH